MNSYLRKRVAVGLDQVQKERFEAAGKPWPGRMCEIQAAKLLGGVEFLKQEWCKGECKGDNVVDHIYGNQGTNSNEVSEYQWLCRSHNARHIVERRPRGQYKFLSHASLEQSLGEGGGKRRRYRLSNVARNVYDEGLVVSTIEMAKSLADGPAFERAARTIMTEHKECEWADLVAACCQEVGCSIQFGDRRMRMLTAKLTARAPFLVRMEGTRRVVVWKEKNSSDDKSLQKAMQPD